LSLLAEDATDIIGDIAFSTVTVCRDEGEVNIGVASNGYGLRPVSVAPKISDKGMASRSITVDLVSTLT